MAETMLMAEDPAPGLIPDVPERPALLTEQVATDIVTAIGLGVSPGSAATAAGVDPDTLAAWLARGAEEAGDERSPFGALYAAIRVAEAKNERALVIHMNAAARKSWLAAAWMLERQFPDHWGKVRQEPMRVPPTRATPIDITALSEIVPLEVVATPEVPELGEREFSALFRYLSECGFTDPVPVRRTPEGFEVAGPDPARDAARLEVARLLGIERVPVVVRP